MVRRYNIKPMLNENRFKFYRRCRKEHSYTYSDYLKLKNNHSGHSFYYSKELEDYAYIHYPRLWMLIPVIAYRLCTDEDLWGGRLLFLVISPIVAVITMFAYGYSAKRNALMCLDYGEMLGAPKDCPQMLQQQKLYRRGCMWLGSSAITGFGVFRDYKKGIKNIYSNKGDRSY